MSGTIALHGGGEFRTGDEVFLQAWLSTVPRRPDEADAPLRAAVVTTAAARGQPSLVGAHGVAAIERAGAALGRAVRVDVVPVLDAASAADPGLAERLAGADAIHLPGGDPDLIPTIMAGSAAWTAISAALEAGSSLAGASAGAMALAAWTWTAAGGQTGLGILPGPPLVVMPHADAESWATSLDRFGRDVPPGLAILGIGERTGVLIEAGTAGAWRVAGEGGVRWAPAGHDLRRPLVYRHGDTFQPDGT
jgi:cyanophycinase-like exopeptidase